MTTRRHFLRDSAGLATGMVLNATSISSAWAHNDPGRVLPAQPVPKLQLTLQDGSRTTLFDVLRGQATAMQLMFTGCSATCPIQGALFSAAQERLGISGSLANSPADTSATALPGTRLASQEFKPATVTPKYPSMRLLSISIDPLSDGPNEMKRWLKRYGASRAWLGGTPNIKELDLWFDFLKARNLGADRHTPQVYFFNAKAELALRTTDFPSPDAIARLLGAMAQSTISSIEDQLQAIRRVS